MDRRNQKEIARKLRRRSTEAERLLWRHLRNRSLDDIKFRRQHPLGRYIVDFVSLEKRLIVELDGGQHAQLSIARDDRKRQQQLEEMGFRVLRFWDNDVLTNIEGVVEVIRNALT